jgi:hypothetical protein
MLPKPPESGGVLYIGTFGSYSPSRRRINAVRTVPLRTLAIPDTMYLMYLMSSTRRTVL